MIQSTTYTRRLSSPMYLSRALVYPSYNSPWDNNSDVTNRYRRDINFLIRRSMSGGVFVGTLRVPRARRVPLEERQRSKGDSPEIGWIVSNPPVKDENGIPIPPPRSHQQPAQTMMVNGRKMRWNGTGWEPFPKVKITTPRWRKPVPVNLKLQHGPFFPAGRREAHRLVERLEKLQSPTISIELEEITPEQSQDLIDLFEAITKETV